MATGSAARHCACGARLAGDNRTGRCGPCRYRDRERFVKPQPVPAEFWDHSDLRAALAGRHFGRVLRAYRCHPFHGVRPLAQGVVAGWLHLTQPQLSRIENGPPMRDLDRLIAWARLLGVPERLLWFQLPDAPSVERSSSSATARQPPGGASDLAAAQSFRAADRQIGGGHLYAAVTSYLHHRVAPKLFGAADTDSAEVFSAAAALTDMAGWMAYEAGREKLAGQHFQRALDLARSGKDSQLVAHILGSLSHLAHVGRNPDLAIGYARQGGERLGTGRSNPQVHARLLAMKARGHAALREENDCFDHLRMAERALGETPTDPPSPWVSPFDEASLAAEAARCFGQLGHLDAMQRHAERVIALRSNDRTRSRAFARLAVALVFARKGRPDEACAMVADVLDTTRALASDPVVRQLCTVGRQLRQYRQSPTVASFLERLGEELRNRRQAIPAAAP